MGLKDIESMDNISIVENKKDLDKYYDAFHMAFLEDIVPIDCIIDSDIRLKKPETLEDAILLTLAINFLSNEPKYYTTTEISQKINQTFTDLHKHKDNVSRYFNQKIYPYYEVTTIDKKLKYKLSATGFSEAISRYM